MPRVRVGDIEMFYVEAGIGDPLVLIMGYTGDHLAWGFQMPVFAAHHRVIAFDNRGAGQTDQPDHPYTTRQMAADTVGLMDALGVERAHVLGVSMGGMISQEIALNHPDRVQTLQLHCTYARPDGYVRAHLAAGRVERTALSREDALRSAFFWLFARGTYNERPEFVEAILRNALANPSPSRSRATCAKARPSSPTTPWSASPASAAPRWSAWPSRTSWYLRGFRGRSRRASPAPSSG